MRLLISLQHDTQAHDSLDAKKNGQCGDAEKPEDEEREEDEEDEETAQRQASEPPLTHPNVLYEQVGMAIFFQDTVVLSEFCQCVTSLIAAKLTLGHALDVHAGLMEDGNNSRRRYMIQHEGIVVAAESKESNGGSTSAQQNNTVGALPLRNPEKHYRRSVFHVASSHQSQAANVPPSATPRLSKLTANLAVLFEPVYFTSTQELTLPPPKHLHSTPDPTRATSSQFYYAFVTLSALRVNVVVLLRSAIPFHHHTPAESDAMHKFFTDTLLDHARDMLDLSQCICRNERCHRNRTVPIPQLEGGVPDEEEPDMSVVIHDLALGEAISMGPSNKPLTTEFLSQCELVSNLWNPVQATRRHLTNPVEPAPLPMMAAPTTRIILGPRVIPVAPPPRDGAPARPDGPDEMLGQPLMYARQCGGQRILLSTTDTRGLSLDTLESVQADILSFALAGKML